METPQNLLIFVDEVIGFRSAFKGQVTEGWRLPDRLTLMGKNYQPKSRSGVYTASIIIFFSTKRRPFHEKHDLKDHGAHGKSLFSMQRLCMLPLRFGSALCYQQKKLEMWVFPLIGF